MRKVTTTQLAGLLRIANNAIEDCVAQHGNLFVRVDNKPYRLKEISEEFKRVLIAYELQNAQQTE